MSIGERHDTLLSALTRIAGGKLQGNKPLCGEDARQIARQALVALGEHWPKQIQHWSRMRKTRGEAEA